MMVPIRAQPFKPPVDGDGEAGSVQYGPGQLALELGHTPAHGESDFLVNDGNELAFGHICSFPDWPGPFTLITGPAKSGKSHLARIFADRSGALMPEADRLEELSRAGGQHPLILEDLDRPGYDEPALFHLLNQSMRDGRPVLMTARAPVPNWPYRTDDVLSRARLAALFSVEADDDIQLSQMFVKLFGDRQITVDPRVIAYLVARMERSPEEAVGLVDLMDRLALARGTAITRNVAAQALAWRSGATGLKEGDVDDRDDD